MSKAAELAALIGSGQAQGSKNLIINGAMNIAQRGTVTSVTNGMYGGPDRYSITENNDLVVTLSQDTDVPTGNGFLNSLKIDVTTADSSLAAGDYAFLGHKFEGQQLQRLKKGTSNAESVTLSFWVKSTITGTYVIQLYDNDNARHISKSYTISSSNTWEFKTLTFAGDTSGALDDDNGHSLQVYWWLAGGSDYTSGTLATSWASFTAANAAAGQVNAINSTDNNFYLTGVQLEVGDVATAFEHEDFGTTLYKCQRYFENLTFANATVITIGQVYSSATDAAGDLRYNVQKRDTPTIGVPSVGRSSGNINFLNNNAGFVATSDGTVTAVYISIDSCMLFGDNYNAFGAAGDASWLYSYGTNTFTIDAEL